MDSSDSNNHNQKFDLARNKTRNTSNNINNDDTMNGNSLPLSNRSTSERLRLAQELESRLFQSPNDRKNRVQLCEHLSDVILSSPSTALEEDCLGRLWRGCFYPRIQELRSRIGKENRKQGNATMFEESLKVFLEEAIKLYEYLESRLKKRLGQEEGEDCLVPCLYRLYIHLGDLLRYSSANHSEVEKTYLKASKLSPGRGNPYNQLAVVAQQHVYPRTCIALYWYARSLLAAVEPFETSRSNLTRLFNFNKTWLTTHGSDQDMMRRFMADFVDFHSNFFLSTLLDKNLDEEFLKTTASPLFENTFSTLLKEQLLSDGLLVKMVAIFIFSTVYKNYKTLSFDSMMIFGTCISSQLRASITIMSNISESAPNIRMMVPLIMLCEWVNTLDRELDSSSFTDFCESLVLLGNSLYCNTPSKLLAENSSKVLWFDRDFEGFSPLHPVPKKGDKKLHGYLTPKQAVEVLGIEKHTLPKVSNDNSVKIGRFLGILQKLSQKKNSLLWDPLAKRFSIRQSSTGIDISAAAPSLSPVGPVAMEDDDCDDEIVYTGAEAAVPTVNAKSPVVIKPPPGFSQTPPPDAGFIPPVKPMLDTHLGVIGGSPLIAQPALASAVLPPPPPPGFDLPFTSNPFVTSTAVKPNPPPGFQPKISVGSEKAMKNEENMFLNNPLRDPLPSFPPLSSSFPFFGTTLPSYIGNKDTNEATTLGNNSSSVWSQQQSLNFDASFGSAPQPPPATKNPFFM